jgi:hypothetical protein
MDSGVAFLPTLALPGREFLIGARVPDPDSPGTAPMDGPGFVESRGAATGSPRHRSDRR